jgi:DNA-directed RNA polymerase subunit F
MLSFALGRPLSYKEDEAVAYLARQFAYDDYQISQLIEEIVRLPEFKHPNQKSDE